MNRYRIPGTHPQHEVIVGWDNPLQTFFCTVHDTSRKEDEPHLILWRGTAYAEIQTFAALQTATYNYTNIPIDVCLALNKDQEEGAHWIPGPAQTLLFEAIARRV